MTSRLGTGKSITFFYSAGTLTKHVLPLSFAIQIVPLKSFRINLFFIQTFVQKIKISWLNIYLKKNNWLPYSIKMEAEFVTSAHGSICYLFYVKTVHHNSFVFHTQEKTTLGFLFISE